MKIAFYTLGCKVNQYETDLMTLEFKKAGFDIVDFSDKADIYVVNSCSVTNLSTRKTRQQLSKAKRQGGIVVLVGCYAEEVKQDTRLSNVDLVLGNEENGISQDVRSTCSMLVKITGKTDMESLNVAQAASILMYILTA